MISKKRSPKGNTIRVTFELPAEVAAESVAIVGDFNDWNKAKHPMKLDEKKGVWSKSISLKPGTEYQFRYFIDGNEWRNDDAADEYVSNPYFAENGVVQV